MIVLSPGQQRFFGRCANIQNETMAIVDQDEDTMSIFVERMETLGAEGSGVWVNTAGEEVHG